jgi:uncharacterized protein (TIGR03435 family)
MTISRRIAFTFFGLVLLGLPIVAGLVTETPILAVGQEPGNAVVFEVAAVRPNRSGERAAQIEEEPGGRYTAINASLRILILRAYQISDERLIGAPDWMRTERFDIVAKLEREPPAVSRGEPGERLLALRSLLAERFELVVHFETRQFPMYALVMAAADGKPGPKLTPASGACSPDNMEARIAAAQAGKPIAGVCGSQFGSGRIQIGGRPLSVFARGLSGSRDIGRAVIDRTGLAGDWDVDLTYSPAPDRLPQQLDAPLHPVQGPPAFDPNGPSLFTALQEQLGLKLESIQGPMEVLVVDRVGRLDTEDAIGVRR